ncbi:MAG: large conductance mechanosensitive channel protein MscL [Chitinophagales bacterium]
MIKEFKDFAMKGNLVDMAIAFVMGGAFGKVVTAFIDGLVMPFIGLIQGKDFTNFYIGLNEATQKASSDGLALDKAKELGPVFAYGAFISQLITFLVVAFVMFLVIKAINKMKKEEAAVPAPPPAQEVLLTEIRDLLKK